MSSRPPLLAPRWLAAHALILAVVVGFPQLGLWQLDRWHEERAIQERIDERAGQDPVPLSDVLSRDTTAAQQADLEFVPVTTTGTYVAAEEVAQRNRAHRGQTGFDWLTPLLLDDGTAVLVRRGFVPAERPGAPTALPAPPPEGIVTVTGWLERSVDQPPFGARDADTGTLATVFHADVGRLDRQVEADLLPMVLHLADQAPSQPEALPVPQSLPERDSGQNLNYAIQWFSFTAIAIIGYAVVLARVVRRP